MAKKKKTANSSIPKPENSATVCQAKADVENIEAPIEEEITLSPDTVKEIGEPDKELVFNNVAKAYEEARRKREKYKKIGPLFVLVSGIIFLALIFTLENKITFLIFWVITILYTVALMIRTEYKYHQFRRYLGLTDEEAGEEATETRTTEAYPKESTEKNQQEEKK